MAKLNDVTKLPWIIKHQQRFQKQEREAPREYVSNEFHFFLEKRYLLKIVESSGAAIVVKKHKILALHVKAGRDVVKRWSAGCLVQERIEKFGYAISHTMGKRMGVEVKVVGKKR